MRDRANCLVSYVVPPVNIQYPAKTDILKSENPLFLLLVQFPVFTDTQEGREDVTVEQPQFQLRRVVFRSPNLF